VTAGRDLIAYRSSDEQGEVPDWRFDRATSTWSALPDDPLPASFDRALAYVDGPVFLFAKSIESLASHDPAAVEVAALDAGGTWRRLPDKPGSGYLAWPVDGRIVVGPMGSLDEPTDGGIFDPSTRTWTALPDAPADLVRRNEAAGAVGPSSAVYVGASGGVVDPTDHVWIALPADGPPAGVDGGAATTAMGRGAFAFGGSRWDGGRGTLLSEAWLWRPPTR
jgi:hypothetical protein